MFFIKVIILTVILVKVVTLSKSKFHFKLTKSKYSPDFPIAICQVVHEIFKKRFNTFNLISVVENEDDFETNSLKEEILWKCSSNEITVRLDNHYHIQSMKNRKKYFNVILLDKFSSFRFLNKTWNDEMFNYRGFYLFVFINGIFKEYEIMKSTLYHNKMMTSSFLFENRTNESLIFERLLVYDDGYCGGSRSVKTAEFKNGKFLKNHLQIFQTKFDNLHGCELTVPTFSRAPSLIINPKTGNISGFDWKILNIIAKNLNFTIKQLRLIGSNKWGTYDVDTGKFTNALKEVYEGPAHLAIGNYILRPNRIEFLDISVSYTVTPLVFTIPLGRPFSSFEKFVKPFDIIIWSIMIFMLFMSLFIILVIHVKFRKYKDFVYGKKIRSPVINMAIAIFGGTQKRLPKRNFARFILMMFLIFCLVQRNIYQSLIFIFMTQPKRHPEISSVSEIYRQNFTINTNPANAGLVPRRLEKIINTYEDFIFYYPRKEWQTNSFLTSSTVIMMRNKNTSRHHGYFLNVCKEPLMTGNVIILMKKNLWIQSAINEVIQELQNSGIIEQTIEEYSEQKYLKMTEKDRGLQRLTVEQLSSIFRIWLIGIGISFPVFLVENFIRKLVETHKVSIKLTIQKR